MSSPILPKTITMIVGKPTALANEILLVVLQYFFMSLSTFKAGMVIDAKFFKIFLAGGALARLRKVSKNFAACAFEAFYKIFKFDFAVPDAFSLGAPSLPPTLYHRFLRRIQVTVALTDRFHIPIPGANTALPLWQCAVAHIIVAADQIFAVCPGARTLRTLSRMTGLLALDLTILTAGAQRLNQATIEAYKSAGIVLRAGEVRITVNPGRELPSAWHTELGQALGL